MLTLSLLAVVFLVCGLTTSRFVYINETIENALFMHRFESLGPDETLTYTDYTYSKCNDNDKAKLASKLQSERRNWSIVAALFWTLVWGFFIVRAIVVVCAKIFGVWFVGAEAKGLAKAEAQISLEQENARLESIVKELTEESKNVA